MNKLNLGCGDDILEGWINIDAYNPIAQVKADVSSLPYDDNFADVILASHVIEHFHFHDGFKVINEWKRVLKPDGKLIIETPDLLEGICCVTRRRKMQFIWTFLCFSMGFRTNTLFSIYRNSTEMDIGTMWI
jgi:predicted SAM-dependent methyltransferase